MKTIIKDTKILRKAINEKPDCVQTVANSLLDKVIFLESQLEQLQKDIEAEGWTEIYQNGANQHGVKKSAKSDVYASCMKLYLQAIKQINELINSDSKEKAPSDPLLKVLGGK